MPRSDKSWPTRRGRRKPLDVVAAQEELAQHLRRRALDGMEAEADQSSPGPGPDATKYINAYSKALDGLTKLQFDTGQLERAAPMRGVDSREAVPSGRFRAHYSPEEQRQMRREWVIEDMEAPEPESKAASDPAGDDT